MYIMSIFETAKKGARTNPAALMPKNDYSVTDNFIHDFNIKTHPPLPKYIYRYISVPHHIPYYAAFIKF